MKTRIAAAGVPDIFFFLLFLAYVWAGIDPRLIYHWQGPVFYTYPGFIDDFLKYPGGLADYAYAFLAQSYRSRAWGAVIITAEAAAITALTHALLKTLTGRRLPLVRFVPAAILLFHASLYYDRTPLRIALCIGLGAAILFARIVLHDVKRDGPAETKRRDGWATETARFALFGVLLAAVYYVGGLAILFFVPAAVITQAVRRRRPLWIAYLALAAALPASVQLLWPAQIPVSAREWFAPPDIRQAVAFWALYCFFALAAALQFRRPRKGRVVWRPFWQFAVVTVGLAAVAGASYRMNRRDHRLAALDYYSSAGDWRAALDSSRGMEAGDFNSLTRYEINLSLHELNRLGDEMFSVPQADSLLLDLRTHTFLPYMIGITDLCMRLGRVNEAERFGAEAMILGKSDPRVYRLMARIEMIKGQTAAARKFLNTLSYSPDSAAWARLQTEQLSRDPQLTGDSEIQLLRRRMLRDDDVIPVWQQPDRPEADTERLLLDQLQQDPSNRMAFEFLMGNYLLARDMVAVHNLMPRIINMTGPAYQRPDGARRTPRHYQEAMAMYGDMTGQPVTMPGLEIEAGTIQRMETFKRIRRETSTPEAAMEAAWNSLRDTYFFYFTFGPGDYR